MKRFTFGTPEKLVPSVFCKGFTYNETNIAYPAARFTAKQTARGFLIEFPIEDDAQIYGFGLQLKQFNHRGRKLKLAVNADPVANTGDSHAPVPFFVTNKGYGMYFDTARYIEVYCGKKKNNGAVKAVSNTESEVMETTDELYAVRNDSSAVMSVLIPAAEGVDVYVIEGDTITDIVSQYNMLSGGGCEVPEWGLGVLYRCYGKYTQDEVMNMAKYFRDNKIPCDILGLEPGWQTNTYSCSYIWSERYPDPQKMIDELTADGFHLNLWEHAFCHPTSPIHEALKPHSGDYMVWGGVVPDFADPEAKRIFADYHRELLTSKGIDGFKLDECDSSDLTGSWSFPLTSEFPSGLDGEQYHSLFGTLYCQAIMDALDNKPTLSEVRNIGALAANYPFVLYSDLYDHSDFIRGVAQSSFSGVLWTPEVRHAKDKNELIRRLQSTVFSVQCLINAWYCERVPWAELDCEDDVRELLELREKLVPMLKSAFDEYHSTGKPPVRALVMDFTDDAETYNIDDEYMFCGDLLVAPIAANKGDEREVYLPTSAKWCDYFTGEPVESGRFTVKTAGIPVYKMIGRS
ncbi:MAG: glycoside hydrolase [Clostridiales bacterium]|nr:glycoside hydrolase [Clostridiales bacterium]